MALNLELPARLPPVLADEDRLNQVLLNLLGNALQYTPAGGAVFITAEALRPSGQTAAENFKSKGQLVISIRDTGIGIAPEHLPHLFTRFYRVDKSRSRAGGGSGIGLTITRHLVEAQGGRIQVESAGEGQGSTFSFTLPIGPELI